jgi:hypothetical protein
MLLPNKSLGRTVDPGIIKQIWSRCASRKAAYAPALVFPEIKNTNIRRIIWNWVHFQSV